MWILKSKIDVYKKMGNIVGNWPRKENTEIRDLSKEEEIFQNLCVDL